MENSMDTGGRYQMLIEIPGFTFPKEFLEGPRDPPNMTFREMEMLAQLKSVNELKLYQQTGIPRLQKIYAIDAPQFVQIPIDPDDVSAIQYRELLPYRYKMMKSRGKVRELPADIWKMIHRHLMVDLLCQTLSGPARSYIRPLAQLFGIEDFENKSQLKLCFEIHDQLRAVSQSSSLQPQTQTIDKDLNNLLRNFIRDKNLSIPLTSV